MAGKKNSNGKEASAPMPTDCSASAENAFKSIEAGLGEVFDGYMKIFLGLARCSEEMKGKAYSMMESMDEPKAEAQDVPADGVEQTVEHPKEQQDKSEKDVGVSYASAAEASPQESAAGASTAAPPIQPITKDDLLREIQAKFRKDRKNQEKVRSILLAYGASGLSLLPAEKYADFLNDVRQL